MGNIREGLESSLGGMENKMEEMEKSVEWMEDVRHLVTGRPKVFLLLLGPGL